MASRMDFMRCPAPSVCSRMKSRGAEALDSTQRGSAQEPLTAAVVAVVVVPGTVAGGATGTGRLRSSLGSCSVAVVRQVRRVAKKSLALREAGVLYVASCRAPRRAPRPQRPRGM